MSKTNSDIVISFVGTNATDVTGSCIHIRTPSNHQILLECGLFQTNNYIESYIENSKSFKFKPKEIDYCFVLHPHIDHIGKIPKLIKEGFRGKVISTYDTCRLSAPLLVNSQYLVNREAERLSKRKGSIVEPLYTYEHVTTTFDFWQTYDYDKIVKLNDHISFKLIHNSHTLGAAQLLLYIKNNLGVTKTILYTSDLGSQILKQCYTNDTEYVDRCNILIAESTYGKRGNKSVTKNDRDSELSLLKESIINICKHRNGKILIPSFSFGRSQYILTMIYDLFNKDDWQPEVVVDSVLTCEINKVYESLLKGEEKEKWNRITNWNRVEFISKDYLRSVEMQEDNDAKVIIASSGYLNGGRSVQYLKHILPNEKDMILFVGYASPNTLAGKIKNGNAKKTIMIEKQPYKNKCSYLDFKTCTGHIQRNEMINYYTNINCEKVFLVHGEMEGKIELKEDLEKEYSKKLKTTNVIAVRKDDVFNV